MTEYFVKVDSEESFRLPQVVLDQLAVDLPGATPEEIQAAVDAYLAENPVGVDQFSFTHLQTVPAAVWEFEHPLAFIPNVTITDSGGTSVLTEISYPTPTTVRSTSAAAFAGSARLS